MANPVANIYGNAFVYYTCDRDPTSNEPLVYNGVSGLILFWWNTTNGNLFWCTDNTASSMVWQQVITGDNLSAAVSALGISAPTAQSYANIALSFGSNRTPSTTKNTLVIANVSQVSVLLGGATANAIVNGTTIATVSLSGVAATQVNALSFLVAPTIAYQISQSTTGVGSSNTLTSVKEFYL